MHFDWCVHKHNYGKTIRQLHIWSKLNLFCSVLSRWLLGKCPTLRPTLICILSYIYNIHFDSVGTLYIKTILGLHSSSLYSIFIYYVSYVHFRARRKHTENLAENVENFFDIGACHGCSMMQKSKVQLFSKFITCKWNLVVGKPDALKISKLFLLR